MAVLDLIQWTDERPDEIVRRVPESGSGEFRLGSQLVVREDQRAVFMRDGKALDIFGPGRHTLSTNNIPLLGGLIGVAIWREIAVHRGSLFRVDARVHRTEMGHAATDDLPGQGSRHGSVARFRHGFSVTVTDPQLLVGSIVGSRGVYSIGQLDDHLKNLIINEFNDLLGDTHTSLLDLPGMTVELAQTMRASLTDAFRRIGIATGDLPGRLDHAAGRRCPEDDRPALRHGRNRRYGHIHAVSSRTGNARRRPESRRAAAPWPLASDSAPGMAMGQAMAQRHQSAQDARATSSSLGAPANAESRCPPRELLPALWQVGFGNNHVSQVRRRESCQRQILFRVQNQIKLDCGRPWYPV